MYSNEQVLVFQNYIILLVTPCMVTIQIFNFFLIKLSFLNILYILLDNPAQAFKYVNYIFMNICCVLRTMVIRFLFLYLRFYICTIHLLAWILSHAIITAAWIMCLYIRSQGSL